MNIILETESSKIDKISNLNMELKNFENVEGIAIKISQLINLNVTLRDLLENTSKLILIDAENERLDKFLLKEISKENINKSDYSRLLVTVQARRMDMINQLDTLSDLGIKIVLVAGNNAYFNSKIDFKGLSLKMAECYQKYSSIQYLGVSGKLLTKIEEHLQYRIKDNMIIELHGQEDRMKSYSWTFVYEDINSITLKNYISRRNKKNISYHELLKSSSLALKDLNHPKYRLRKRFVNIDSSNRKRFLWILNQL